MFIYDFFGDVFSSSGRGLGVFFCFVDYRSSSILFGVGSNNDKIMWIEEDVYSRGIILGVKDMNYRDFY